MEHSDIM